MKQTNTLEMEIIRYLQTITNKEAKPGAIPENSMPNNQENTFSRHNANLPGRHVIANIMGYARALQILKCKRGEQLFLIGN